MSRKLKPLIKRQRALEATMQKFRGRPFDWDKSVTCIHMLRFHLKRMGYDVERVPKLDGPIAAKRELKARGFDSITAFLNDLLEPILVAEMLPGDVSVLPDDSGLDGVVIALGAKVIGFHETEEMLTIMEPIALERAWRV